MPRFFFDFRNGETYPDAEGCDLPDLNAAIQEAVRSLPEIAAETLGAAADKQSLSILVRDQGGTPVYNASLLFSGTRL
jgi:hypothetical protein